MEHLKRSLGRSRHGLLEEITVDLKETEFWGRERRTGSVATYGEHGNVPECSQEAGNWLN